MSGVWFAVWLIGCVVAAFGIVSAGYNGDDGWSWFFMLGAIALVLTGIEAGWLG